MIAFICILVYVAAVAVAAVRIYLDFGDYRLHAREEFYELVDRALVTASIGFMSQPYQQAIQESILESQTLEGVIITGFEGNRPVSYPFERVRGNSIDEGYHFKKSFGLSPDEFRAPLPIEGQGELSIRAVYQAINYPFVVSTLKFTLLIIAACTGVAFLTLFIGTVVNKNRQSVEFDEEPPLEDDLFEEPSGDPIVAQRRMDEPSEDLPPEDEEPEESLWEEPRIEPVKPRAPEAPKPAGVPKEKKRAPVVPAAARQEFSRSNIRPEAEARERLTVELHRAVAGGRDLVFIALGNGKRDDPEEDYYRRLTDEAAGFFGGRDLLFERGKGGVSVIIPGMDLDDGLEKTREFQDQVLNALAASFPEETGLRAGLSSRSERPVDADRLMFEAGAALERALQDPDSPIIAFRSDPEKYRAFMDSQRQEVFKAVQQNMRRS